METSPQELGAQARALYGSETMCCSEAVLSVINTAFDGGLTVGQTLGIVRGLCGGIGDAGCVCGALSAAAIAQSLILSKGINPASEKSVRRASKRLHNQFIERFGSVCCRTLCSSRNDTGKGPCMEYVAFAAEICAQILWPDAFFPGGDEGIPIERQSAAWRG